MSAKHSTGMSSCGYHWHSSYSICPQKWAYRNLLHLSKRSEAADLGTLLHVAFLHFYLALQYSLRGESIPSDVLNPIEAMRTTPPRVSYRFADALPIYQAYRKYWDAVGEDIEEVISVEEEYSGKLPSTKIITARLDVVYHAKSDGLVYVIDHKSTSGKVATHHRSWEMSGQMVLEDAFGEGWFGDEFGGVKVNVVGTKAPFEFARPKLNVLSSLRDPFLDGLAEVREQIESDLQSERSPWKYRRNMEACGGMRFQCDYIELCKRGRHALGEFEVAEDVETKLIEGGIR
jgi:hypothetical protein